MIMNSSIIFFTIALVLLLDDTFRVGRPKVRNMVANAISDGGKFGSIWLHNYYRSQLARGRVQNSNGTYLPTGQNVYALIWDQTLADFAQQWANGCQFKHSNNPTYGENLFMSTSTTLTDNDAVESGIRAWWAEIGRIGLGSVVFDKNVNWEQVGHAMQMAWSSGGMNTFGCAVARCPWTFLVCEYGTGNIWSYPIYNVGQPCRTDGDCKSHANSICNAGLGLCMESGQSLFGIPAA